MEIRVTCPFYGCIGRHKHKAGCKQSLTTFELIEGVKKLVSVQGPFVRFVCVRVCSRPVPHFSLKLVITKFSHLSHT